MNTSKKDSDCAILFSSLMRNSIMRVCGGIFIREALQKPHESCGKNADCANQYPCRGDRVSGNIVPHDHRTDGISGSDKQGENAAHSSSV